MNINGNRFIGVITLIRLNKQFDYEPYHLEILKEKYGLEYTYATYKENTYNAIISKPIVERKKDNKIYQIWYKMIKQESYTKFPYTDITVCKDWHDYFVFEDWYKNNVYTIPGEKVVLKKDLLVFDNNEYSPEMCVFAPYKIIGALRTKYNSKSIKEYVDNDDGHLISDIGISYQPNRESGLHYVAYCQYNGKNTYLGRADNPQELVPFYKAVKEYEVRRIADEYKDYIPDVLYDRMINFVFNPEDYIV